MACSAYIGREACPMRFSCQQYSDYLKPFIDAQINEKVKKPKSIPVVFLRDKCVNFRKKI